MKDEAIAHAKEETADWKYMKELPETIRDFRLQRLQTNYDDIYDLYTYTNESLHRSVTVYYHAETNEYKLRFRIGSFEFCHEECIAATLEDFEILLRKRFDNVLLDITSFDKTKIDSMLKRTNILEWDFSSVLPDNLDGFELFIRPSNPLRITNGSYIILDYEFFSCQSNFAVYYNIFRDEFFSDARIAGVPDVNYEFDSQTLEDLQNKLSVYLDSRLQTIRDSALKEIQG